MLRVLNTKLVNPCSFLGQSARGLRGQSGAYRQERVVLNEDGSVIVCWHPEPKFPFELTRPVPRTIPVDSKFKVQAVEDMKELYHYKHERLVRRDLMRLTWTTKHRWFPNNEHRYSDARKMPRERPFL